MFGDLPNTPPASFVSRPIVSLRQHTFTEVGADFDVATDPEGRRLIFASTRHNTQPDLYIKSVDGVAVTQLTADPAADIQPDVSPDGTRVAFASNRTGNWDIWVMRLDGGRPIQVTSGPADDVHPSWSPDGKELVFSRVPAGGGQWELWITDATGAGMQRFIGYGLFPEWSPVDDRIVYQRARERGNRWFSIWVITLENGEPSFPTELAAGAHQAMILPSWSPDGTRIVYASSSSVVPLMMAGSNGSTPSPLMDIWMMSADGREKVRLTDGFTANYGPVFSAGGRVFFTTNRSGHENVWSVIPPPLPSDIEPRPAVTERRAEPKVVPAASP